MNPLYKFPQGKAIKIIPKATFKGLFGLQFIAQIGGKMWSLPHHQELNQKLLLCPKNQKVEVILVKPGLKHQQTKYYINKI